MRPSTLKFAYFITPLA